MKRDHILYLLKHYVPSEKEAKKSKGRMIDFILRNESCFDRSLLSGHITASSWLLNQKGTHALLMHHSKLNIWVQLGGHCDGNSDPLAIALKEASEESGLSSIVPVHDNIFDIDIHLIPESNHQPSHYHYDVRFLLRVDQDDKIQKNHESKELRWIDKDPKNLPTDELSVTRMFYKWILFQNSFR